MSKYRVFLVRIQSKCGKIRTRKYSVFGHVSHSINDCDVLEIREHFRFKKYISAVPCFTFQLDHQNPATAISSWKNLAVIMNFAKRIITSNYKEYYLLALRQLFKNKLFLIQALFQNFCYICNGLASLLKFMLIRNSLT